MSLLDGELSNAKRGVQEAEKRLGANQQEQRGLNEKLKVANEANQRRKAELAAQARKMVEAKDKQVQERRRWAQQQQQLQENGIRDLRTRVAQADEQLRATVQSYLQEEKQANRGVQPSAQEAQNLLASVSGLGELMDQLIPPAPSAQQQRRLDAARRRVVAAVAHETVTLRKQTARAGIPAPTYPSTQGPGCVPRDIAQPVVRVHLNFEGVAGLVHDKSRHGRSYSIAAMRNGRVHEAPRRPAAKDGTVDWGHSMSFLTRLAPPGQKAADLLPCCVAEYMADGSLSESLPFDVDLAPLACQSPKQIILLPLASAGHGGRLRVCCQVHTTRVRPKVLAPPAANPLRPLGDLWGETREFSRVAAGGDSSGDEGAPPAGEGGHADPTRM